jgi:hypothetical protein
MKRHSTAIRSNDVTDCVGEVEAITLVIIVSVIYSGAFSIINDGFCHSFQCFQIVEYVSPPLFSQ